MEKEQAPAAEPVQVGRAPHNEHICSTPPMIYLFNLQTAHLLPSNTLAHLLI